jgi:hypothetical protein
MDIHDSTSLSKDRLLEPGVVSRSPDVLLLLASKLQEPAGICKRKFERKLQI